ncbi:hypothetical protein V8D89_006826 [Ganoderma adspersum]
MHRALLTPEILYDVCAYATDGTLVSLALSCKAFNEAAIQALWHELRDLSPLMKCFPEDAWTIEQERLRIVRSLAPDDWAKFHKYSSHVRHLGTWWTHDPCTIKKYPTLDRGAVSPLSIYRPTLILFPRLVELNWKDSTLGKDDHDLPVVLGLIGPYLKRISIVDWSLQNDDEQHLQTSLSLISTRFQSLRSFNLHCKQTPMVCKLIPGALPSSLKDLRSFRCDRIPVSENAFLALGRLQHLNEFSIRLPALLSWAPLPPDAFPALRNIEITALTRDYLALGTDVVRFPLVKDVIINLRDIPTIRNGLPFFDLISRQFSHTVLSGFSVYMSNDANIGRSRQNNLKLTLTRDTLRPLLSFTDMNTMVVNLACPYALDGDFCSEIAQAFPKIECLLLGNYDYCYHEPPMLPLMTQALVPFATHCPELSRLGITFDARQSLTVDDVRDALPQRPSPSAVIVLECSHCPIGDAHMVAAYLARVFPMMEGEFAIGWYALGPTHPLFIQWRGWERIWREVQEKLPWFTMIRDDERAAREDD